MSNVLSITYNIFIDEALHLFYPWKQKPFKYGGVILSGVATKQEVISNIKEFLQIKNARKYQESGKTSE